MQALLPAAALLLALLIDRYFGEPPARLHPVVWIGHYLGWAGRRLQRITQPEGITDYKAFWLAAIYWCVGAAIISGVAWGLSQGVLSVGVAASDLWTGGAVGAAGWLHLLAAVLLALLLKPMLAWAMLKSEVQAVETALAESLAAGRTRLSWLVSRDVTDLTEAQVRESAIESLAENLSDSVIAPIFWFVLLGLPGAALYRFANTADAMWGYPGVYKGQNWQWAGKWAARADDVLSWLPARLTAWLFWLVSGVTRPSCAVPSLGWGPRFGVRPLRLEAHKTPSPNSGWPMAAMALGLGLRLGKPGVYALNPTGRTPDQRDTVCALVYAQKTVIALVSIALIAILLIAMLRP